MAPSSGVLPSDGRTIGAWAQLPTNFAANQSILQFDAAMRQVSADGVDAETGLPRVTR